MKDLMIMVIQSGGKLHQTELHAKEVKSMQSDYMYMNDVLFTINEDIKVIFKTIASINTNNKIYYNCSEFKLNNDAVCNTMIKRNLSYYIYIDDRRSGKSEKLFIYPEHMFTLLEMFKYAKKSWYTGINAIYGCLENTMVVVNNEYKAIRLPMDKIFRIEPGVMKHDLGDRQCLDMYLNTPDVVQISLETFDGLYYVLSNLDMLTYANMSLSFMMLRYEPSNRLDYTTNNSYGRPPISTTDSSLASGSSGRSFNGSNNKSSLLE